MTDNLKLWNDHEETPPDMVKWADTRGGFASVDAYFRLKKATEEWGPLGDCWGLRECEWDQIAENGQVVGIVLRATFFYPDGCFPIVVDGAYRPNGDTYKKLTTGALTKALSYLGFSADAFMGKFADEATVLRERKKFDTETQHENTVKSLMNLLEKGIGCKTSSDQLAILYWAGIAKDVAMPGPWPEGFPVTDTINAIRAKVTEEAIMYPDVLDTARKEIADDKK